MNQHLPNTLNDLRKQAQEYLNQLPIKSPAFELQLQWSRNYDDLFARAGETSGEDAVLPRVLARGRCILAGRGGAGKTQLLYRTMQRALDQGILPILIRLKDWTSADYEHWKQWTAERVEFGGEFLLKRFSTPHTNAMLLDALPPDTRKLVIVDGLNEIAAPIGQQILLSLDELARDQIGMYVLVADRLTRRDLPSPTRWSLGTTLPVSSEQISKLLGTEEHVDSKSLLGIPYYLDVAIQDKTMGASRSAAHAEFLIKHGGLTNDELNALADAALQAYLDTASRTFAPSQLKIAAPLTQKLVQAGILLQTPSGDVQFSHHLLHDYLAARRVAQMKSEAWTPSVLRTISFDGGSFDTISMVFSFLQGSRADEFLRMVYDWNPYAAGYALSDGAAPGQGPSQEMQAVMLAMLAEKMFDILEPTSRLAKDAISLVDGLLARSLEACESIEQLLDTVRALPFEARWFVEWKSIFTLQPDDSISDEYIRHLCSADSVMGWTVANVAKRTQSTDAQQTQIRSLVESANSTVKWRIAHVLGALPSVESVGLLKKLLVSEPDPYVKYGALRSLLEAAARAKEETVRRLAVDAVLSNADDIHANPRLFAEVKRALLVRRESAPATWAVNAHEVSRAFFERETNEEGRDFWRKFVAQIDSRYGA